MGRIFFLLIILVPTTSFAFYQFDDSKNSIDARGFLRVAGWATQNPNNEFLYENDNDAGIYGLARLLVDAKLGDSVRFEFNAYEFYSSSALEWTQRNDKKQNAAFTIDRMNVAVSYDRLDVTIGRQPINLATVYYFTPNDFFAPFSASTFYRVYKPGVDAIRAEFRAGMLTQITLVGVLGYKNDASELSGWSDEVATNKSSTIGRITTVVNDYEFGLLGGTVSGDNVIGGSFQGEFLGTGLRVEGNFRERDDGNTSEISAELDRRFNNSLNLRFSFFHHGAGVDSTGDYLQSKGRYLARRYMAGGAGYEFTPLFYGEALLLLNAVDGSYLASLYSVYSLSDEAELSVSISMPVGDEPDGALIRTEYGAYPALASFEFRAYF